MADDPNKEVASAISQTDKPAVAGGTKKIVLLAMYAVVVLGSAAVGSVVSKMMNSPKAAQAAPDAQKDDKKQSAAKEPTGSDSMGEEFTYYDFEPIVANLNGPRLERFVRVTVVLSLRKEDSKAAEKALESKKRELKSWLTVYFSGCSVDDVRGPKNLNRIRREIEESLNEQLWRDAKPLISHVLFKDFAVQ